MSWFLALACLLLGAVLLSYGLADPKPTFCTSYTDNRGEKRTVYLSRVFAAKTDRSNEYAAWLKIRYEGVWEHRTHCREFSTSSDASARLAQDIDDFRELGHRVVQTDWTPDD